MAKIISVDRRSKRRKKWEHFKINIRLYAFRLSLLINILFVLYVANEQGLLTNIIKMVSPIMEAIINKLPL
jgi:hypothetical protein